MFSPETISRMNARSYAVTLKAAKGEVQREGEFEIKVNLGYLAVGGHGDSSILYIRREDTEEDKGYYVNRTAGFQRWHKSGASRIEALGWAKQVGVTVEMFKEAFPFNGEEGEDPIDNVDAHIDSEETKVECDYCGESFDVDQVHSVEAGVDLCEECEGLLVCGYCGEHTLDEKNVRHHALDDNYSDYCGWCAAKSFKAGKVVVVGKSKYEIVSAEYRDYGDDAHKVVVKLKNVKTGKERIKKLKAGDLLEVA